MSALSFARVSQIDEAFLFLSGYFAIGPKTIEQLQLTCIVDAANTDHYENDPYPTYDSTKVDYVQVKVEDNEKADLSPYFHSVADKIEEHRLADGKVLVHCAAGISRSTSLCLAYMIKYRSRSLKDAFWHIKASRPFVNPNNSFWRQLIAFEKSVRNETSVKIGDGPGCYPDILEPDDLPLGVYERIKDNK